MKSVKLIFLMCLLPLVSFATEKHEKQKQIKRSYKVSPNATLSVDNTYGEMDVEVWDKNVVELDVRIVVSGTDLKKVTERLDAINIDFKKTNDLISVKTIFKGSTSTWTKVSLFGKQTFLSNKIFYIIKIPKTLNLKLKNKYGSVSLLSDVEGETIINCKYSNFFASALNNPSNNINLDYASGSRIFYMKSGDINAKYSEIEVEKAEKLDVDVSYTDLDIGKVTSINFDANYGDVTIDQGDYVTGDGDYTDIKLKTINKSLNIDTDYGDVRIENYNCTENSSIQADYAKIRVSASEERAFKLNVSTSYAKFNYPEELVKITKKEKTKTGYSQNVKGYFNKLTKNTLTIDSDYGNVSIKKSY